MAIDQLGNDRHQSWAWRNDGHIKLPGDAITKISGPEFRVGEGAGGNDERFTFKIPSRGFHAETILCLDILYGIARENSYAGLAALFF